MVKRLGISLASFVWAFALAITCMMDAIASFDTAGSDLLEIRIIPNRAQWHVGDTITGKLRLTNNSQQPLTVWPLNLLAVTPIDVEGKEAISFAARLRTHGGPDFPLTLEPAGTRDYTFRIITDPLNDRGGYLVGEGQYELTLPATALNSTVKATIIGATIDVRIDPERQLGRRIIDFAAGSSLISVIRENGQLASYDIVSGVRVATKQIRDYELPAGARSLLQRFSSDATRFAKLDYLNPGRVVHLYNLAGATQEPVVLPVDDPPRLMRYSSHLAHISEDFRFVYVVSRGSVTELSVETGKAVSFGSLGQFGTVSTDGRYRLGWDYGGSLAVVPRDGGQPVSILPPGRWESGVPFPGVDGVYLTHRGGVKPIYASYDGSRRVEFSSSAHAVVCASDNDKLVVLTTSKKFDREFGRGPGRLEIWSVETGNRAYTIDDQRHRLADFGDNRTLVSVLTERGDGHVSWLSENFEVREAQTGALIRRVTLAGER